MPMVAKQVQETTLKQVSATLHIRHGAYVNHLHTYERILDQYKTGEYFSPKVIFLHMT